MRKNSIILALALVLLVCWWVSGTAASPSFVFLGDYLNQSALWHRSSVWLRVISFAVTVVSACVALLQKSKHRSVAILTVVGSLLVAVLNGLVSFVFLTDYRSYEKAASLYSREINEFKAAYQELDLSDSSIADEYKLARIDLVKKLEDIKVGIIEGTVQTPEYTSLGFMPEALARQGDHRMVLPSSNEYEFYFAGSGQDTVSLGGAKRAAIENVKQKIANTMAALADTLLEGARIPDGGLGRAKAMLSDSAAVARLFSTATTENRYFSKNGRQYSYTLVVKLPKATLSYIYSDVPRVTNPADSTILARLVDALKQRYSEIK